MKNEISKLFGIDSESFNIATGIVIEYENNYLFSIQNKEKWKQVNGIYYIGLVGIGGGCDEQESIDMCLERECIEEIGECVKIIDEIETYVIERQDYKKIIKINFLQKIPYAITLVKNKEPYKGKLYTVVCSYRAVLEKLPNIKDIYGFIIFDKKNISKIKIDGMSYSEWKNMGTDFITKGSIPENSFLIPFGTFKTFLDLHKK